ncbi:hypothetical protein [Desulfocicer vacuolatum]|nr:hypothetical protein [Desulfocicer vacuolatum]
MGIIIPRMVIQQNLFGSGLSRLGHTRPQEDSRELLVKIEGIIKNIAPPNKLIITSRLEILLEAFSTEEITNCRINKQHWEDLTITDNSVLKKFWIEFAKNSELPQRIIDLVKDKIEEEEKQSLLQIGQLNFVANVEPEKLQEQSVEDIEHIARYNSENIAKSIQEKNKAAAEILAVLGFCSTVIDPVSFIDLGYIFSDDQKFYAINKRDSFILTPGGKEDPFPKYSDKYDLDNTILEALEYLEERQLIRINDQEILFSHPNYYEASRYLFCPVSKIKQKKLLTYLKRSLSCLNPKTTQLATKQFEFLYTNAKSAFKNEILNLAIETLSSIFPGVEDSGLLFLMYHIDQLGREDVKTVVRKIQQGGTNSERIYWYNNKIPYISQQGGLFVSHFRSSDINVELIENIKNRLKREERVSSYEAWTYINNLDSATIENVALLIPKTLLQQNEAFIRKKVASIFIAKSPFDSHYEDLIGIAINDEHPDVVFSTVKALVLNWTSFNSIQRHIVIDLIENALKKRAIAIRMYNFVTEFETDYEDNLIHRNWKDFTPDEKKSIWQLWGRLYLTFSEDLPLSVYTNTGRFGLTMDEAMKHLDVETGVRVLEKWFKRIDYQVRNGKILDEYELAVADNLIFLTQKNHKIRSHIFDDLISHQETDFLLSSLKWIVGAWNYLDITEKDKIIGLLKSDRTDLRWIKAVLLNSHNPPKEVLHELFGDVDFFCRNYEDILDEFSDELLEDSLHVYCGFPQPLWWLAVHHHNEPFWGGLIRYILVNVSPVGFNICLEEFLRNGVNGFPETWNDGFKVWEQVCDASDDKRLLADSLIFNCARSVYNFSNTKRLWDTLIDSYAKDGNEDEIISIIVENIELLQHTDGKDGIFRIFKKEFFFGKIFPKLIGDNFTCQLINEISDDSKDKIIDYSIFLNSEIRLLATVEILKKKIEKHKVPDEFKENILNISKRIKSKGEVVLDKMQTKYEYQLPKWFSFRPKISVF